MSEDIHEPEQPAEAEQVNPGRVASYDMTIIGGGSGGPTAARIAAVLGANVLLIDKERLGGDCLHYGCVPSKSLIHVAKVVQQAKPAARFGLESANLVSIWRE